MKEKLDSSREAIVDGEYNWKPITAMTPRGVKVQLISYKYRNAYYGQVPAQSDVGRPGFPTHYAPIPTFSKDEDGK